MIKFPALLPCVAAVGLAVGASVAMAQSKKELAAKIVQLQQPAIEQLARGLAQVPASQMLNQAGMVLQSRIAADKREAIAKDIQADAKKYMDEAVPLLRDRAIKLGPTTIQPLLEEKFTEDELKQVIAMLESPAIHKYQQMTGEMETALREKLIGETRQAIEPKLLALDQSIGKRLGVAPPPASSASAPAPKASAPARAAPKK